MNKYRRLFNDIVSQTEDGAVRWKEGVRRASVEVFFKPGEVFSQYSAQLVRGNATYQLVLVERMVDVSDLKVLFPKYVPELLVMGKEGEVLASLNDSVIERGDLLRFAKMVRARSETDNSLFEADA